MYQASLRAAGIACVAFGTVACGGSSALSGGEDGSAGSTGVGGFVGSGGARGTGGGIGNGGGGGLPAGECPRGQTLCGDRCVSLATDLDHCGACDSGCGRGELCDGTGNCNVACQVGMVLCDGRCIDPLTDERYCGARFDCEAFPGQWCRAGELCNGRGQCELNCQAGLVNCDGRCIDPLNDEGNCGAGPDCAESPGRQCAPGEICNGNGLCVVECADGLVKCGDRCIDPLTDETYCGAGPICGLDPGTTCAAGELCNGSGQCELNCQSGLVACDRRCIDPLTSDTHCGAGPNCVAQPGDVCASDERCEAGVCQSFTFCPEPLTQCDEACTLLSSDPLHCGSCGNVCDPTTTCAAGECRPLAACTNLAPAATGAVGPGGGHVHPFWPKSLNDGIDGTACTGWAWVANHGTPAGDWFQYTWPQPVTVSSMFIDGERATNADCGGPNGRDILSAEVQYWNGATWVTAGHIGGQENYLFEFPAPVTTTALRLYDVTASPGNGNSLIYEWYVFEDACPVVAENH